MTSARPTSYNLKGKFSPHQVNSETIQKECLQPPSLLLNIWSWKSFYHSRIRIWKTNNRKHLCKEIYNIEKENHSSGWAEESRSRSKWFTFSALGFNKVSVGGYKTEKWVTLTERGKTADGSWRRQRKNADDVLTVFKLY